MCEILQHFNAASPLAHSSSGTLQCAVFLFKYTHNPIAVQVLATGHDNTVSSIYHNFSLLPHQFTRRAGNGPFVVLQLADLSNMPAGLSLSLWNGDLPKKWCRLELSISSSREFCEEVGVRCKYYCLFLKISSPLLKFIAETSLQIRRARPLRHRNCNRHSSTQLRIRRRSVRCRVAGPIPCWHRSPFVSHCLCAADFIHVHAHTRCARCGCGAIGGPALQL